MAKPATYDSDVAQIQEYYTENAPVEGDEEYLEVAGDASKVKHYMFENSSWEFKGYKDRSLLDVEEETNTNDTTSKKSTSTSTKQKKEKTCTTTKKPSAPKTTKTKTKTNSKDDVDPESLKVKVCEAPKRGTKKLVTGLAQVANLVATGKREKAIAKIQSMLDDLDTGKEKEKKEPSPYNKFVAENMAELKASDPTLSASERMKRTVERWNAQKAQPVA